MISLIKKENNDYCVKYIGNTMNDYMNYTAIIGNLSSKFYSNKYMCWMCNEADAAKIKYQITSGQNDNIGAGLKLKPYAYQKEAIAFGLKCETNNQGALFNLGCGAGKSLIGIGLYQELQKKYPYLRGVIVVKATLKSQWLNEIKKFTDYNAIVINTSKDIKKNIEINIKSRKKKIQPLLNDVIPNKEKIAKLTKEIKQLEKNAEKTFDSFFDTQKYNLFIVNYETLLDKEVFKAIKKINPDFWYVDEIDAIKNSSAKRTKVIYKFNNAKYRFGATATPIRKNPKDIFGIFGFLQPSLFPNETAFDREYLTYYMGRISGSKNEKQLAEIIQPYIFYRSFDQIADQLPTQLVKQVFCDLTPKQQEMNDKLMDELKEYREKEQAMYMQFSPEDLKYNAEMKQIENAISARQTFAQMLADSPELLATSESNMAKAYCTYDKSSKVEMCLIILEKIISSGEKVCIFSKFLGIQDILQKEIKQNKVLKNCVVSCIRGNTNREERNRILTAYNTKENYNILLLSDAAEAGINLSSTKYMIEFELAESAAKQTQRHGRIQRADSIHKNVIVFQLIARNSYDEIAQKIIEKKQGYADKILA